MRGWGLTGRAVVACAAAAALTASAQAAQGAHAAHAAHAVRLAGASLIAPSGWPIVDLARDPHRCVRFDRHAVYVGTPGATERCPAAGAGERTASVLVQPLNEASVASAGLAPTIVQLAGRPALVAAGATASRTLTAALPGAGVLVTISYASDPGLIDRIVHSVRGGPRTSRARAAATATTLALARRYRHHARPKARAAQAVAPFTGQGFDACAAPSSATMTSWLSSPYRAIGVYIGGRNRACAQPNLTAAWVTAQESQGWHLLPIYVGLQAPCGLYAKMDPATAGAQGIAAGDDAANQATQLALGAGSPVFLDLEPFADNDSACDATVITFVDAWIAQLHRRGFTAGVYVGTYTGARVMVAANARPGATPLDFLWLANWNGRNTAYYADPVVADSLWSPSRRVHQFAGGHDETWGGAAINIDNDAVDLTATPGSAAYAYRGASLAAFGDARLSAPINLAQLHPGQDFWVVFSMSNSGLQTWQREGANPVRLGTWSPQDRSSAFATSDWLSPNRSAALQQPSVAPGQAGSFLGHMRAPASTGPFAERFNLVAELATWMPDQGLNVAGTIVPVPAPPRTPGVHLKLRSASWHRGVLTFVISGLPKRARLAIELRYAHRRTRRLSTSEPRVRVHTDRPRLIVVQALAGKRVLAKLAFRP
jgi:hypothetical protein